MQKLRDWRKDCIRGWGLGLHLQDLGSGFSITVCSDGGLLFRTAVVLRASFVKSHFFFLPHRCRRWNRDRSGKESSSDLHTFVARSCGDVDRSGRFSCFFMKRVANRVTFSWQSVSARLFE